ncbi:MSCRAMM family protein, partial [Altererythrobacter sp. Z27]|uniref:MSCRAMM family protein n=1 Tax=Altererythrobacter sp. Z27 TaxID=3461147 RepID=UPI004043A98D
VAVDTLTSGATDSSGQDFYNTQYGSISGYKYEDADGVEGGVGTPVDNWKVTLYKAENYDLVNGVPTGAAEGFVYTGTGEWADGYYEFTGLVPGDYVVVEEGKEGWFNVTPTAVAVDTLTSGATDSSGQDFYNTQYGSISGTKFIDADGIEGGTDQTPYSFDSEDPEDPHAGGWTIYLYDGDPDDGGVLIDTTWTDENGDYSFEGLPLGTYWVLEETKDGWTNVSATKIEVTGTGTSGFDVGDQDFANFELFDISGTKYEDENGNAAIDDGEAGLEGWKIYIDENNNEQWDEGEKFDITDENGDWEITGLDPSYNGKIVREVDQNGWTQTVGPISAIVAMSGDDSQTFDFANFQDMFISGYKWADANNNSEWDEADTAVLSGWTIVLDQDDVPDNGNEIDVQVTNVDGYYSFTITYDMIVDDADGILHVYEVMQDGFTQTYGGELGYFSFSVESGLIISGSLGEAEDGNFGNYMMQGANRTPGFWQSKLGFSLYDGNDENNGDANGDGSPDGDKDFDAEGWSTTDLLTKYGIDTDGDDVNDHFVLWDADCDGVFDEGEDIYLTPEELRAWVSGGGKGGNGGNSNYLTSLERDLGATFLNSINNHSLTTPDSESEDPCTGMDALNPDIADDYATAVSFILQFDPDLNGMASGGKKAWQDAWKAGGSEAHNELAMFNESGEATVNGFTTQVAMDGDDYSSSLVQGYLDTLAKIAPDSLYQTSSLLPPEDLSMLAQTNLTV